ncbi:4-hydroxy-tetrahydrodipicolinate synthase [Clostridium beijerinckii]|uniref:4-hydroxy-tetrahydrodipicolinate synthase n=1 Tax=Clostridium beijerinckii TaxID=1520 RepID=A0A1S8SD86_CLOBE|nr:4-hydroxy-tetrahydrodipicolinate synthase [Clostridium beijerinckii]NRY60252.1 4-hydroxy-tetrahydrodipicolinate synthase [Clostridium beijerinckii]OOM63448.1 4-hydroxy-tetrahydrodipicolinate synthase [Clostridium beijerinckii]
MFKPNGIIPALVTPLDEQGNLMESALKNVIDYTLEAGVHGVFVLGSTGEIYGLTDKQKQRVMEVTVEHVNGRVPVYAGAGEITTINTIKTAQMAENVGGISALSVITPYFVSPSQDELVEHYTAVANSVNMPIILYGCDGRAHNSIMPETVLKLSEVENIIGIKDSSGSSERMDKYLELTKDIEDFSVLCGIDTFIYHGLCNGTKGAIASSANVAPKISVGIYNAVMNGDHEKAQEFQKKLQPLRDAYALGTFPGVIKEALRMVGVDAGVALKPVGPMSAENREKLAQVLKALEVYNIK